METQLDIKSNLSNDFVFMSLEVSVYQDSDCPSTYEPASHSLNKHNQLIIQYLNLTHSTHPAIPPHSLPTHTHVHNQLINRSVNQLSLKQEVLESIYWLMYQLVNKNQILVKHWGNINFLEKSISPPPSTHFENHTPPHKYDVIGRYVW